jgi:exosortase A-associated hydrolase 2
VGEAFFFEHEDGALFAVLGAAAEPPAGVAVVFCHPYGEEKQLTDRVLVRFARRLEADGFATLRFDCRGYGESAGALGDAMLDAHVAETLAAAALARARTGVDRVVLLGLRLGATVAALAAERDPAITGLVLWSPIMAGRTYVRELLRKKLAAQLALQDGTATRDELVAAMRADGRLEFEGGYLPAPLYDELSALDLPRQVTRYAGPVFLTTLRQRNQNYGPHETLAAAYRGAGAACELAIAENREYWDVKSMFDGVFPDALYEATGAWMRAQWPRPS